MQSNLVYHYTSVRSRNLWKPFLEQLNNTYLSQIPESEHLLIFGGSSGHCLSSEFFKRFSKITIYDTDPIAPLIFKFRHGFLRHVDYEIEDAFSENSIELSAQKTLSIIKKHNPSFILFSNVIGQLPIYYKSFFFQKKHIRWSCEFLDKMSVYSWLSFHDIFSVKTKLEYPQSFKILKQDSLHSLVYRAGISGAIHDHMVLEQNWPRPSVALRWDLYRDSTHYIEVTSSNAMRMS